MMCRFTLNSWDCFDPLVAALNSKNNLTKCLFITSTEITQDSFIYKIAHAVGEVKKW